MAGKASLLPKSTFIGFIDITLDFVTHSMHKHKHQILPGLSQLGIMHKYPIFLLMQLLDLYPKRGSSPVPEED